MLKQIACHLWVAEQPLKFLGLEVGTRMTVISQTDNSLLIISPIQIDSTLKQQLDSLGTVKYIIAPNLFHHLFLADCQQLYPNAKIIAPPGIKNKQPNLEIALSFLDFSG